MKRGIRHFPRLWRATRLVRRWYYARAGAYPDWRELITAEADLWQSARAGSEEADPAIGDPVVHGVVCKGRRERDAVAQLAVTQAQGGEKAGVAHAGGRLGHRMCTAHRIGIELDIGV